MRRTTALRQESGLTLMELIIVLAIIAVIGAILAPNFLSATDKARLKSDIQSAKVIQSAIELYNAEQPTPLTGAENFETIILPKLSELNYLKADQSDIQTHGAVWKFVSGVVKVDISSCDEKIKTDVFKSLNAKEKEIIDGGAAA